MLNFNFDPKIQDTITIFLAIVIEAIPFIVLGVLISTLITAFVKDKWLLRLLPKNRLLAHMAAASLGMFFPVCECGNVPLMRKLLDKGFTPSQAISFYLGAPIINLVVFASTISAFSNSPVLVVGRFVGGFLIAVSVGIIISMVIRGKESVLVVPHAHMYSPENCDYCEVHDHAHDHHHHHGWRTIFSKGFVSDFSKEFLQMSNLLVLGAAIAALTQIWLPRDFVYGLNSTPILAIAAMMLLAFVISVCSTVDAFVALGYATQFSPAAILGFLIFGPMIDIKAISMLTSTFKPKLVALMVALVVAFTLSLSLILSIVGY